MSKGKLFLLPNLLSYHKNWKQELPIVIEEIVVNLDGIICESEKAARRYLALFREKLKTDVNEVPLMVMESHLMKKELSFFFEPIEKGGNWGVVVDSGLACIADPGSKLVTFAYQHQIEVKTFAGPSAIVHALQLSGFYAQQFHFLGYLPQDKKQRVPVIRRMGFEAKKVVQILIETPYRNDKTLQDLIDNLPKQVELCIAKDLFMESEEVMRGDLAFFKELSPTLKNHQCIFLLSG